MEDTPTHSARQSVIRAVIPSQLSLVLWCRPLLRQGFDGTLWFTSAVRVVCLKKNSDTAHALKGLWRRFLFSGYSIAISFPTELDAALLLVAQQGYFNIVSLHLVMAFGFLSVPSVTISFSSFSLSDVFGWNWLSWLVNKHLFYDYILSEQLWRTCIMYIYKECRMSKSR